MFGQAIAECTAAEWQVNPDTCEIRNLQAYEQRTGSSIGIGITTGPAPLMQTMADLERAIVAANGTLYVWSGNVSQSPELSLAKASPTRFKVVAGAEPGEYAISLKSATGNIAGALFDGSVTSYLPYIVGGALLLVLLKR